ncbi:GNAT family N-acetyltransferase [Serratia marcescens]|nr:GNAT family N-acetyltransferase [Serratia marcescens]HBC7422113.1 GNAT family N-acetyltransferase [Serratia marcescens]HBC7423051.1 GNAT family N-acetyltransferase [Serratia marcescens]
MPLLPAVHIETERLILRPHNLADFDAWYAMFTDKELFKFISAPNLSPEDGWNRLLRYIGHWSVFGYGLFAIFRKVDGQFLGETGLADFHRGLGNDFDGSPEAAWIIARRPKVRESRKKRLPQRINGLTARYHPLKQFALSVKTIGLPLK